MSNINPRCTKVRTKNIYIAELLQFNIKASTLHLISVVLAVFNLEKHLYVWMANWDVTAPFTNVANCPYKDVTYT